MKKLTFFGVAIGLVAGSLSGYAATPTGAAPFQVMIPNINSGFDFTLKGLYLQPSNPNLEYLATTTSSPLTTLTNSTSVNPDYDFGFGIGIGYTFPNSGNTVRANWTHFDHSTDGSVLSAQGTQVDTALSLSFPVLTSTQTINSSSDVSFKYDAVDLSMSQHMSIGTRLQTRLFAGLRYANIKNDQTDTYISTDTALPLSRESKVTSAVRAESLNYKFEGIGPRVGIGTSYHLADCFGVAAHFATALLVGRVESSSTGTGYETTTTAVGSAPTTYVTTTSNTPGELNSINNQTRVVPALEGKLGLDYTLGFNKDTSRVVIEAGYEVTQYVDVLQNESLSGVGFNGFYLSLNFKI